MVSLPRPVKSALCRQRLATIATFIRSCVAQALSRSELRRNTASAMKICFFLYFTIIVISNPNNKNSNGL